MPEINFCTRCGENVSPEALYCPACGAPIEGRAAADGRTPEQVLDARIAESRMYWILMLLIIYAIPAICVGIYLIVNKGAIANILMADQSFSQAMAEYGITADALLNYLNVVGIIALISGISAAVSTALVYKRRYWLVAVSACALASFLCIGSIFGFIIGLIVTWMIFVSKDCFDVQAPPSEETSE